MGILRGGCRPGGCQMVGGSTEMGQWKQLETPSVRCAKDGQPSIWMRNLHHTWTPWGPSLHRWSSPSFARVPDIHHVYSNRLTGILHTPRNCFMLRKPLEAWTQSLWRRKAWLPFGEMSGLQLLALFVRCCWWHSMPLFYHLGQEVVTCRWGRSPDCAARVGFRLPVTLGLGGTVVINS